MASHAHRSFLAYATTVLIALRPFYAIAQVSGPTPPISEVVGTITDSVGAVIPNAEVRFVGELTVTTKTAQDGSIRAKLPHGRYLVTIASPGFKTAKIEGFLVDSLKPVALNMALQVDGCCVDEFPGTNAWVPTISSELPNAVVEERSTASPVVPIRGPSDHCPVVSKVLETVPEGGQVTPGRLIKRVNPTYPADARKAHIEGTVVLCATISTDGIVQNLRPLFGPQELIAAAVNAARQWRYMPYRLNNKPVEVDSEIRMDFKLSNP